MKNKPIKQIVLALLVSLLSVSVAKAQEFEEIDWIESFNITPTQNLLSLEDNVSMGSWGGEIRSWKLAPDPENYWATKTFRGDQGEWHTKMSSSVQAENYGEAELSEATVEASLKTNHNIEVNMKSTVYISGGVEEPGVFTKWWQFAGASAEVELSKEIPNLKVTNQTVLSFDMWKSWDEQIDTLRPELPSVYIVLVLSVQFYDELHGFNYLRYRYELDELEDGFSTFTIPLYDDFVSEYGFEPGVITRIFFMFTLGSSVGGTQYALRQEPPNAIWKYEKPTTWGTFPGRWYDNWYVVEVPLAQTRIDSKFNCVIDNISLTGVVESVKPVAFFYYSTKYPLVGEEVIFDASSSYDPDGEIAKYEWYFDGPYLEGESIDHKEYKKEGKVVSHVFSEPGIYYVRLNVWDYDGNLAETVTPRVLAILGAKTDKKVYNIGEEVEISANVRNGWAKEMGCQIPVLPPESEIPVLPSDFWPDDEIFGYPWDEWDDWPWCGEPIASALVKAEITKPDGSTEIIFMREEEPGYYKGIFRNTYDVGSYSIKILAEKEGYVYDDAYLSFLVYPLIPGDILLGVGTKWVFGYWSHVGMYIGNGEVVESHKALGGVAITPLEEWFKRYPTWAALRVITANEEIRKRAINWATDPDRLDDPYDGVLMWWQKDANGEAWYCSELVWAAYLHASNGQIDIEYHGPWEILEAGITPDEIYLDQYDNANTPDIAVIAGDYDYERLGRIYGREFIIVTESPVDLEVVDPDNLVVNKQSIGVPGAGYGEYDIDGDGDLEDWIAITEPKAGKYLISVIPEPGASPADTYTLKVLTKDGSITFAENVSISDIPEQPYLIECTKAEIKAAPIANANGPYEGNEGSPIIFDGSRSFDPDGEIIFYEWDWDNDGIYDESTTSPTITHTWDAEFSGTVRLRVTDNDGLTSIDTASVEVTAPAITGDLDNDGDVDQNDLNILLTYRNQPASACPECDIDGDGIITVLDARKLVLMCTRPRCACE